MEILIFDRGRTEMQFYSTWKLIFAYGRKHFPVECMFTEWSRKASAAPWLVYKRTVWFHTKRKRSSEHTRKIDSGVESGAPAVLFLSDNCAQANLVEKQISWDAANLPVLTPGRCGGRGVFCNTWRVWVKWEACGGLGSSVSGSTAAWAGFYTWATGETRVGGCSNVTQRAALQKRGL